MTIRLTKEIHQHLITDRALRHIHSKPSTHGIDVCLSPVRVPIHVSSFCKFFFFSFLFFVFCFLFFCFLCLISFVCQ